MSRRDSDRAAAAARLVHDVGKYVARTARNVVLDGAAVAPAIVEMLCRDLFALPAGGRASSVLAARVAPLPADARLSEAHELLDEADRLEASLREGDPAAIVRAVEIARSVEKCLREYARTVR